MSVCTTASDWMPAPITLNGSDEFAIGDVHGHLDLLEGLVGLMAKEAPQASCLTFLGDLIDRGPDSRGCLKLAAKSAADLGFSEKHVLFGNHELMMLAAMGVNGQDRDCDNRTATGSWLSVFHSGNPEAAIDQWTGNGGWSAMESFGLVEEGRDASGNLNLAGPIRDSLGEAACLLDNLETHRRVGNLMLVHAGLNPLIDTGTWFSGNPFRPVFDENQHFAWIRFPFFGHEGKFEDGLVVVHGHTPEDIVLSWKGRQGAEMHRLDGWRLGLDGGSYRTGRVAGAQFRNGEYRVFVASRST